MKNFFKSKIVINIGKVSLIFVWIICLLYFFMFITEKLNNYFNPEPEWDKVGVKTIGTVSQIKTGRPNYTSFTFIVDDEEYMAESGFSPFGLTYTERYEIIYSKENYEKIKVIPWKPVILKSEEDDFIEIEGEVVKLVDTNPFSFESDYSIIRFEFKLNDKIYEKSQSLPPNFRELYPNIESYQTCKVKYWKYDPQRAILDLDKCFP